MKSWGLKSRRSRLNFQAPTCDVNPCPLAIQSGNWKSRISHGGFLKWGIPKMDGFFHGGPINMDDLGVPLLQETSVFLIG